MCLVTYLQFIQDTNILSGSMSHESLCIDFKALRTHKVFFGHSKEAATGRQTVDRFSARNFVFYSHTRSTFWLRQEYIATINLVPFLTVDTGDVCHPAGFFGTGALVNVSGASISAKFWVMLFELDSVSPEYPGEQRKFPPCLPPFDFGIW